MRLVLLLVGVLCIVCPPAAAQPAPTAPADTAATPQPAATAALDSLLEARLRRVYSHIEDFSGVQVQVRDGVVSLTGTVAQVEAREEAAALAARLGDVLYVDNDLVADTDVEMRVSPALERVQRYIDRAVAYLPVAGIALLIVLVFSLLGRLVMRWEPPYRRLGLNPLVWGFIRRLVRTLLLLLGFLLAFDVLGITALVGALLGTAGILGLALGFAFQDIVENYLAGFLLSLRQPFQVNDLVRAGEHEGQVVRLTSRELVLLSFEGNHIRMPNALVFKSVLINYTLNPRRLFHFDVGIGVEETLQPAQALGVATLQALQGVLADPPPFARVQTLGDSSVIVRYHAWVDQREADFLKVRSEAIRLVKAALDEAGIELPEPIYRVQLQQRPVEEPKRPDVPEEASARAQAARADVRPDGKLEAQVREELTSSDEENLLRPQEGR